ncbi:radical SAM protein, partial [bacterium]|nr:radical SAM protein [bacterium]
MKGFYIKAFGCKLNQYEAEYVRERLETHLEYTETSPDIVVVYGCTVTSRADAKVRRFIRRARRMFPQARIVLLGCSSRIGESFGADELFPDTNIFLASLGIKTKEWFDTSGFFGHTRSFVKIQDGCERFCSYCIVPFTRGAERSRPSSEIIEQTRRLTNSGFKEVVLTGVRVAGYSFNGYNLVRLLEQLLEKTEIPRIRLSSIDPDEITDELIDIIAGNSRIMP